MVNDVFPPTDCCPNSLGASADSWADNGSGNTSSRSLGRERADAPLVEWRCRVGLNEEESVWSSRHGSGKGGKDELWIIDWRRRTILLWAWQRETRRLDDGLKTGLDESRLGNSEDVDSTACIG